jgi:hypothetical protein
MLRIHTEEAATWTALVFIMALLDVLTKDLIMYIDLPSFWLSPLQCHAIVSSDSFVSIVLARSASEHEHLFFAQSIESSYMTHRAGQACHHYRSSRSICSA